MNAEQLMLYFNLGLTALIVLGALRGYIQGFKKSLYKIITEIVFWLGFFLTADLVVNLIFNSKAILDLVVSYVPISGNPLTLVEFFQCVLVQYVGVSASAEITTSIPLIFALVSIVLKLVYLIIYSILIRLIYVIVCNILWHLIFHRRNMETHYKEKRKRNGKIKRIKNKVNLKKEASGPRILGLVFGGGRSLIGITLTISLLMSVVSLLPKELLNSYGEDSNVTASNQTVLSNENKNIIQENLAGLEEYIKFIDDLENSPYVKLVRTIKNGDQTLDLVLFDTVMNGRYEECNIKTRESLAAIISIGYDVVVIIDECQTADGSLDLNKINYNHLAGLVDKVTQIDLLMEAIPAVLEIGLSMESLKAELPVPIDDELKNTLVAIDWKKDIKALANVVITLGEVDDFNEVINNPISLLSKNNEKVICEVITQLSELTFVTELLPTAVEFALSLDEVKELVGDATIDLSNIVWEEELVQVAEIYSVFQSLSNNIVDLLFVDEIEVDNVVDGININALNDLILKIFELGIMEELFEPIMDEVVSNIEDEAIREMLNFEVDNYDDWAKEFSIIIDIVKELLADGNPFGNEIDINMIVKNIRPETISQSKILSELLVSVIVDASNGEGLFAKDEYKELKAYIDVPSYLHDKNSPAWYDQFDEEGNLISKGQLHKTIEALKTVLPKDQETIININDTLSLSYKLSGVEEASVVWGSLDSTVASVTQSGLVTAVSAGHTVIFVSTLDGKVKDMIDVIVTNGEVVPVEYVLIENEPIYNITIGIGQENRKFLSASTNLDATNQVLTWESLTDSIVKVSNEGAIEGLQVGSGIVKVTSSADATKFAICNVTVVETLPLEIKLNKNSLVGHVDKVFYVDASIDGSNNGLTYKVNDESIASVSEDGFVSLLKEGETTLTISNEDNSLSKTIPILVVSKTTPTSIKIVTGGEMFDVNSILSSLDEEDIDTIIGSEVLTRSLSKILLTTLETNSGDVEIHIPSSVVKQDGSVNYISTSELENILDVLTEVDISAILEGKDVTNLLEDLDDDSIDAILKSKVLSAFLSSTISSVGGDMIVVPSTAYRSDDFDYCYKHPTQEVKYLKNEEVKSLVKMIKDYDLLSGENLSIELSEDNSELVELVEDSDILRATLSKFILDMSKGANASIVVPDQALEEKGGCKLLKVSEFEAVLNALYGIGIEEISESISLDLTVGDLSNGIDSINESIILRATVSDYIYPVEEIVIPDQANDSASYTVDEEPIKVVSKVELKNLVIVLNKMLGSETTFDNVSLDITVGDLSNSLEEIKDSIIIKATISDLIVEVEELVVPDQANEVGLYTKDGLDISVLKEEELDGLVNTLVNLLGSDAKVDTISLDLTIGDLNDSIDDIKSSKILMATISDNIVPLEEVVVPDQALDNTSYTVNSSSISVLYEEELESLVDALVTLLGVDATVDNISLDLTVGDLKTSLPDIKASKVLKATVSDKIVEVEELVVPDQASEVGLYTKDGLDISVLKEEELDGLVNTLVNLLGSDAKVDTISLDLTIGDLNDSIDDIKSSKILMATISDNIIPLEEIIVPDNSVDKLTYTVNSSSISVLYEEELESLVDALVTLLGVDATVDNISLDLTVGDLNNSVALINASGILRTTVSDKIIPLTDIIVPDEVVVSDLYHIGTTYYPVLTTSELVALVDALDALLGSDASIDNIELSLTVGELNDSVDKINLSGTLRATVSDKINDVTDLVKPDQGYDLGGFNKNGAAIKVLTKEELKALTEALEKLLGESAALDSLSLSLTVGDLASSVAFINDSVILRATVSDKIIPNTELVVPDEVVDKLTYSIDSTKLSVLEKVELVNVVSALESLLGESAALDSLSLNLKVKDLKSSIAHINTSAILRATVSDKIIPNTELVVPDEAIVDNLYSKDSIDLEVLEEAELIALVNALEVILGGETSLDNIELNLTVGKLQDSLSVINNSLIIRSTVSDNINGISDLIKPNEAYANGEFNKDGSPIDVLTTSELEALVDSLVALLGESAALDTLEINLTVGDLYNSTSSINNSLVLRATITDMVSSSLDVPEDAIDVIEYHVGSVVVDVLTKDELVSLAKALMNIVGDTSLDSITIATDIFDSLLLDSDEVGLNKLEQSLKSIMIWNEVSTMIDSSTGSLIVVPDDARVGGTTIAKDRITVQEINNLMKALNVLGVTNIENVSLDANFIFDLDDETKDALGNTELTRTTIALEKSKILMASIPGLFEDGIESAFEEPISISFDGITLEGTLNSEGTAYVADGEGELVKLFRAVRAADVLKTKQLADLTGKISNPNSSVSFINEQFLIVNDSTILKPTVAQVLAALVEQDELNGGSFSDEEITLILSKSAAGNDLYAYAVTKATEKPLAYVQIMSISTTKGLEITTLLTVAEVEATYDEAVAAIDAL